MFSEWITELCSNLKRKLLNNLKSDPEGLSMDSFLSARKRIDAALALERQPLQSPHCLEKKGGCAPAAPSGLLLAEMWNDRQGLLPSPQNVRERWKSQASRGLISFLNQRKEALGDTEYVREMKIKGSTLLPQQKASRGNVHALVFAAMASRPNQRTMPECPRNPLRLPRT